MDNNIYGYEYHQLRKMQAQIKQSLIEKVKGDINERNGLIRYLLQNQNQYRYRYIYIDDYKLVKLIEDRFPKLITQDNDERRYYYVISANDRNLRNQELIKILIENGYKFDDYRVVSIPEYLETYDEVMEYYKLF
jgi:hypothetical protein